MALSDDALKKATNLNISSLCIPKIDYKRKRGNMNNWSNTYKTMSMTVTYTRQNKNNNNH